MSPNHSVILEKTSPTSSSLGASKAKRARKTFNLSGFILLIPHGIKYKSKLFPAGFSFLEIQGGKQQITFSSGGWTHLREREFLGVSREFEKLSSGEEGTKDSRRGRNSTKIDIKSLPSVSTGGNHGQTKTREKIFSTEEKKGISWKQNQELRGEMEQNIKRERSARGKGRNMDEA